MGITLLKQKSKGKTKQTHCKQPKVKVSNSSTSSGAVVPSLLPHAHKKKKHTKSERAWLIQYSEFMVEGELDYLAFGQDIEEVNFRHIKLDSKRALCGEHMEFLDDFVENTRSVCPEHMYDLYHPIPYAEMRCGLAKFHGRTVKTEAGSSFLENIKNSDLLFDYSHHEVVDKEFGPAPVIELCRNGVAEQFERLKPLEEEYENFDVSDLERQHEWIGMLESSGSFPDWNFEYGAEEAYAEGSVSLGFGAVEFGAGPPPLADYEYGMISPSENQLAPPFDSDDLAKSTFTIVSHDAVPDARGLPSEELVNELDRLPMRLQQFEAACQKELDQRRFDHNLETIALSRGENDDTASDNEYDPAEVAKVVEQLLSGEEEESLGEDEEELSGEDEDAMLDEDEDETLDEDEDKMLREDAEELLRKDEDIAPSVPIEHGITSWYDSSDEGDQEDMEFKNTKDVSYDARSDREPLIRRLTARACHHTPPCNIDECTSPIDATTLEELDDTFVQEDKNEVSANQQNDSHTSLTVTMTLELPNDLLARLSNAASSSAFDDFVTYLAQNRTKGDVAFVVNDHNSTQSIRETMAKYPEPSRILADNYTAPAQASEVEKVRNTSLYSEIPLQSMDITDAKPQPLEDQAPSYPVPFTFFDKGSQRNVEYTALRTLFSETRVERSLNAGSIDISDNDTNRSRPGSVDLAGLRWQPERHPDQDGPSSNELSRIGMNGAGKASVEPNERSWLERRYSDMHSPDVCDLKFTGSADMSAVDSESDNESDIDSDINQADVETSEDDDTDVVVQMDDFHLAGSTTAYIEAASGPSRGFGAPDYGKGMHVLPPSRPVVLQRKRFILRPSLRINTKMATIVEEDVEVLAAPTSAGSVNFGQLRGFVKPLSSRQDGFLD